MKGARRPLANVIDFASAVKRREESKATSQGDEPMSLVPFSFDAQVSSYAGTVEMVIDRALGVGLTMDPETALKVAKALRAAARAAKKQA